jgi:hypothetical protein
MLACISLRSLTTNTVDGRRRVMASRADRRTWTNQIGADDGMAAIAHHVRNGTAPCTRFPNPMRQILDGEQLLDGDRRCLIKIESARGI